jgi:hypothetical protein
MVQYEEPQVTRMVSRIQAPETTSEQVVMALHGALGDAADDRMEPEDLQLVCRAGGRRLDARQLGVVESLARQKLATEDAQQAIAALRGEDGGPEPRAAK